MLPNSLCAELYKPKSARNAVDNLVESIHTTESASD